MTRKKRRDVHVRGVVMDNQEILNEGEANIVAIYVTSDSSAYYIDDNQRKFPISGNVLTYTPRFL